jgi:hypothetical protein
MTTDTTRPPGAADEGLAADDIDRANRLADEVFREAFGSGSEYSEADQRGQRTLQ